MWRPAALRLAAIARCSPQLRSQLLTRSAVLDIQESVPSVRRCQPSAAIIQRGFAAQPTPRQSAADKVVPADIEFATGLEREELQAQAEGATRFETGPPQGPFGTQSAPAVVESQFDERIVGCSGGFADEEHDVVWFKLKKEEPYECPVCAQVFALKVVGHGGLPGAHH
eukprot:TRINITY_DN19297_c0_g1_i1.p1 TRINITY_DN19297_c0_g1~~TRINITY_DN19297_c0_g1_i1.p1  ORF type:complete len:169 (+),score=36.41 TRINITY_DN19297_c0_g1_i1:212-718(+)